MSIRVYQETPLEGDSTTFFRMLKDGRPLSKLSREDAADLCVTLVGLGLLPSAEKPESTSIAKIANTLDEIGGTLASLNVMAQIACSAVSTQKTDAEEGKRRLRNATAWRDLMSACSKRREVGLWKDAAGVILRVGSGDAAKTYEGRSFEHCLGNWRSDELKNVSADSIEGERVLNAHARIAARRDENA